MRTTTRDTDYELIDSGLGERLERFGDIVLRRPDPQALWPKQKSDTVWNDVHATFSQRAQGGVWRMYKPIPPSWEVSFLGVTLTLKITSNKHVGVFPEQIDAWKWMTERIVSSKKKNISVLNLFAYTGGASCVLARAGATVTHVDSAKHSITWAHTNKKSAGVEHDSIRFMLDDVRKFVEREIKRGNTYDAILLDPPVYGKGVKKEGWHIEEDLLPLIERTKKLLSDTPVFFVLTGYASEYKAVTYGNIIDAVFSSTHNETGELYITETNTGRRLPAGIFARIDFTK